MMCGIVPAQKNINYGGGITLCQGENIDGMANYALTRNVRRASAQRLRPAQILEPRP